MYPAVLIVDDEATIIESLEGILSDDGFEVIHAFNGYEALKKIESESPDIVLLDIWMPGMDGIETLKEIKKIAPNLPVVMITGHGTIESAVDATKSGAYDFLEKPLSIDKVMVTINNALNFRKREEENIYLRKKSIEKNSITGTSHAVQKLYEEIMNAAPSDASILISGENGTGKEMVARTIHQLSLRPEQPFIIINCAAIPEENLDSELFGHEKGAFKKATSKNKGKFELASGGTLFLDEIGDMNINTQAKILRALESKTFQRIGGGRTLHMDARLIASSNKDLEKEIEAGNFRKDLFFRLNVIPIIVPPLRDRKKDIPLLVDTFLENLSKQSSEKKKNISENALGLLLDYEWQGNVRELKNLLERLSIMVGKDHINAADIPQPYNPIREPVKLPDKELFIYEDDLSKAKKQFEKDFIKKMIDLESGDLKSAAKKLGTSVKYIKKIIH
ncbi:MAG: sigma-54-dependent Fis family transcriptional regulator [Desulfobacula sp.]|jgi:two-component system nitrogen regulation response regulator NtrX|uniref:sigma-54-dependent transcriptional regulator n=1 Tax=Desulfobacula sp. TaxID=2593537 RepID=UPI001DD48CDB|nr:sigma-54-dependent Fis family transcriptional regulator [Desulfobacula sp.]MBT3485074.1 sigma-54-dependent Fis family transcriptional regulator [Desulfobacula sp.]MBT3804622.1 sigma-54-dependent Fis family transcriptional regulator [Desulfobacula sp.]MBT4025085.1 sigma-54-dependent Fis family transcriptional regulator [Desulfobacula sp.]MBT4198238.1 sigma-54-dependent Fis family transcriptional regulator [Desulfobacula sp.]